MDLSGIGLSVPDFGGAKTLSGLEFEPSPTAGVLQMKSRTGGQYVRFYHGNVFNLSETKRQGRPVYDQKLMVHIATPGDRTEYDGIAEDYHRRTYFQQYSAFKEGKGPVQGTPLSEAEFLQGAEVTELEFHRIYTIEQLADASDLLCEELPHGYEMREHARVWCQVHDEKSARKVTAQISAELQEARKLIEKLSSENARRDREMAELRSMISTASVIEVEEPTAEDLAIAEAEQLISDAEQAAEELKPRRKK